jgi:predicted AlkP superfamily pyrophosphatase or phosphodiesterase
VKNKLIIISVDALVYEDLAVLAKKPTFKKILEEGSRVNTLRTIYPSVTYPVHESIITGMYPDKHGVINNEEFQVGKLKNDWNWFHDVARVKDIFDYAKAAGKTTAAVFWPVTGNHPNIDYLIDKKKESINYST